MNYPSNTKIQGLLKAEAVKRQIISTFNPRTGGQTKETFEGTEDEIVALATQAQQLNLEYTVSSGHVWTLEVTYPYSIAVNGINQDPDPIPMWELGYYPYEKNVLECNDRPFIAKLSGDTKKKIEEKLRNPSLIFPFSIDAMIAYNMKVLDLSKQDFVYTLKRSVIVPNNWKSEFWNNNNTLKIFKTKDLLAVYASGNNAMPEVMINALPRTAKMWNATSGTFIFLGEGTHAMSAVYFIDPRTGITYSAGWLEYPLDMQYVSLNKVQLSQSWVWNVWSSGNKGLYYPYTDPEGDSSNNLNARYANVPLS